MLDCWLFKSGVWEEEDVPVRSKCIGSGACGAVCETEDPVSPDASRGPLEPLTPPPIKSLTILFAVLSLFFFFSYNIYHILFPLFHTYILRPVTDTFIFCFWITSSTKCNNDFSNTLHIQNKTEKPSDCWYLQYYDSPVPFCSEHYHCAFIHLAACINVLNLRYAANVHAHTCFSVPVIQLCTYFPQYVHTMLV